MHRSRATWISPARCLARRWARPRSRRPSSSKTLKEQRGKGYADTKLFQAYPDAALALSNKTVDVAFIPSNVAAIQMRKQPGAFKIVGEVGQPRLLAWVANPQDLEIRKFINDTLDELHANGKLTALQTKWFGAPMDVPRANYLPDGAI